MSQPQYSAQDVAAWPNWKLRAELLRWAEAREATSKRRIAREEESLSSVLLHEAAKRLDDRKVTP